MSSYASDWKGIVKRGIDSYVEALKGIQAGRRYAAGRVPSHTDEPPPQKHPKFWIPLLWGTF